MSFIYPYHETKTKVLIAWALIGMSGFNIVVNLCVVVVVSSLDIFKSGKKNFYTIRDDKDKRKRLFEDKFRNENITDSDILLLREEFEALEYCREWIP